MKLRILHYWDRVRSGYWFLPSLLSALAISLAYSMVALDAAVTGRWLQESGWAYTGGAEGASAVLAAIAGSMITIAGVVFSLTLLTLSLASTQFGPRLLRNFMRDLVNQLVLGSFVSTFLYCLLVLRTIRHEEEVGFVPHLSVTVGVLMAVGSIALLIYFIHHVSASIQVDRVIARVYAELTDAIDRLFPERLGSEEPVAAKPPEDFPADFERDARAVATQKDGYLQAVDGERLLGLASEHDFVIRLERRPGHYLLAGATLARVWPGERVEDRLAAEIDDAFVRGEQRTPPQDLEFAVNQLVEIAVRALSPGVNDPFTAITSIDRLGSALCRLAGRAVPSPFRYDEANVLRLVAYPTSFPAVVDAAFNQIRQYGRSSAAVTIRLLEVIAGVGGIVTEPDDRAALRRHAAMIERGSREALAEEDDRRDVEERYQTVLRVLRESGSGDPAPEALGGH